jgi:hypothetical protein
MPDRAFEVEHSTDIQNSLLKFVEWQDFNIKFTIVASIARQAEFKKKYSYDAFRSIRGRVKFINYDQVSQWHTKTAELSAIERELDL